LPNASELARHLLIGKDNFVEGVGDFAVQANPVTWKAHGEIAISHGLEAGQYHAEVYRLRRSISSPIAILFEVRGRDGFPRRGFGRGATLGSLHGCLPSEKQLERYQKAIPAASPDQQPEFEQLQQADFVAQTPRQDRR